MYRLTSLIFLLLITVFSFSQENTSVLFDDANYANLFIQTGVGLETDFYFRSTVVYNVNARYYLNTNPIVLDFRQIGEIKNDRKKYYENNLTTNDYQRYNSTELFLTYNFRDQLKKEDVLIKVGSRMKSRSRVDYYTSVNAETIYRLGVRVGFIRLSRSLSAEDGKDGFIKFNDDFRLPIYTESDNFYDPQFEQFYSAERHLASVLGLSYSFSNGVKIKWNNTTKSKIINFTLYSDFLYALSSDIQKFGFEGQLYDPLTALSGVELNKVGYRIGINSFYGKKHGIYVNAEAGKKPHYLKSHFYLQLGLGYLFNQKI